jgi:phosphopantetheinyl transferase
MFHGPRWQAVAAVEATAPAGARALLRALSGPRFLLDPIVLDAAGQLIGFWTAERLERGRVVFPFRLAALDLYAPPAAAGEEASCTALITLSGDRLVRSDIEVRGTDGRPWMRLTGWEDKRFDVPAPLEALIRPSGGSLSTPFALPGATHLPARRIDIDLVSDRALWLRVWAQQVLTPAERERFRALQVPERRRLQWLAARTAAKEAVEALTGIPARSVEIDTEAGGRPVVRGDVAAISLAHTDGVALALAAPAGRVGVDVERLASPPVGFAEGAFAPSELDLLPAAAHDEWLLRAWCAKEAVAKALGNGLGGRPQALPVTSVDLTTGRVTITVDGEQRVAATAVQDDLVVATTQCQ